MRDTSTRTPDEATTSLEKLTAALADYHARPPAPSSTWRNIASAAWKTGASWPRSGAARYEPPGQI